MDSVSETVKTESIQSLQSTIRKMEKGLAQMAGKGTNTTLIEKRLRAVRAGLAVLESAWNQQAPPYGHEALAEARDVLRGMMPSIEKAYANSTAGSPQRTLLERRLTSLKLAIQELDDFLEGRCRAKVN